MISMKELENLKNINLKRINLQDNKNRLRIVVGMATCGIAAGAKPVMNSFKEEIKKRNLKDIQVKTTGCIGVCRLEPMVEITNSENQRVTYVKMTPEKVKRVVVEHLVNGRICIDYTIGSEEE
ncbi:MAG: (2Fe-2S) ferredoxin domain-containing protein [Clostridiales bacterium]